MRNVYVFSRFSLAIAAVLLGAVFSCARGHERDHMNLSSVDPLRTAFNADSGKIRAIFLASPT
jgi:hypothetical protein